MEILFMCGVINGFHAVGANHSFQVISPISLSSTTKVSELMSSLRVWNFDLIHHSFLKHDAEAILSIPLASGRGHLELSKRW